MIATHIPTWFLVTYGVAAVLVLGYLLLVALDVEFWYRDVRRRRK